MGRSSIGPALFAVAALAALVCYMVPRGLDAHTLLAIADDPVRIADRALDGKFNAAMAQREIETALANGDADLAQSFVDLAAHRHVGLDSVLIEKVKMAIVEAATARHKVASFARGLVSGEPDDIAALAGTALGDLFVFGDIRDALREGGRRATGQKADELVLGLACVGLAITAGTYASFGAAAPIRAGLTLAKAARKVGSVSTELAAGVSRTLRGMVDWGGLKKAGRSIAEPALAVRAAREAVKVERAGGLIHLARDVGRVEQAAGARAALESLKIAEKPRDVARVAKLAEKEGNRTRAILKVAGRGAIVLTAAAFDVSMWILGALFAIFGFVSSLKSATERITLRIIRHRKNRRLFESRRQFAALTSPG